MAPPIQLRQWCKDAGYGKNFTKFFYNLIGTPFQPPGTKRRHERVINLEIRRISEVTGFAHANGLGRDIELSRQCIAEIPVLNPLAKSYEAGSSADAPVKSQQIFRCVNYYCQEIASRWARARGIRKADRMAGSVAGARGAFTTMAEPMKNATKQTLTLLPSPEPSTTLALSTPTRTTQITVPTRTTHSTRNLAMQRYPIKNLSSPEITPDVFNIFSPIPPIPSPIPPVSSRKTIISSRTPSISTITASQPTLITPTVSRPTTLIPAIPAPAVSQQPHLSKLAFTSVPRLFSSSDPPSTNGATHQSATPNINPMGYTFKLSLIDPDLYQDTSPPPIPPFRILWPHHDTLQVVTIHNLHSLSTSNLHQAASECISSLGLGLRKISNIFGTLIPLTQDPLPLSEVSQLRTNGMIAGWWSLSQDWSPKDRFVFVLLESKDCRQSTRKLEDRRKPNSSEPICLDTPSPKKEMRLKERNSAYMILTKRTLRSAVKRERLHGLVQRQNTTRRDKNDDSEDSSPRVRRRRRLVQYADV